MGEIPVKTEELDKRSNHARYLQLDGIKGIICFFIIFVHYYNRTPDNAFPITWIPHILVADGWMFVEFFFIISGFLFAKSWKKRIPTCGFRPYILSRLKRLYPSVVLITVFDALTRVVHMWVNHAGDRITLGNLLKSLTFASTWLYNEEPFPTVLWYIHVLFLCYLLYYFIAKRKTQTQYITAVVALVFFGWALYAKKLSFPFLYKNIGRGYLSFGIGLLIYEFQTMTSEKLRRKISYWAFGLSALSLAAAYFLTFDKFYGDMLLTCTLFLFPAAMLSLLNIPWIGKIFSIKPLVWLGEISMSTFLVHVPVMNLIKSLCKPTGALPFDSPVTFAVVLVFIFVIAVLWHYLIEKKLIPMCLRQMTGKSA